MRLPRFLRLTVAAGVLAAAGCGGSAPSEAPAENLKKQSTAKLEAMRSLAAAVSKNDQPAINLAVETLTATTMDVKANLTEAKEIVELYKTKVKGKLKGDAAAQVQSVVAAIEAELK